MATRFPALGLGAGFDVESGTNEIDYAARLWDVLRDVNPRSRPRHDSDLLAQAAQIATSLDTELDSQPLSFSEEKFEQLLARNGTPWPRLASGRLALDDDTFRYMVQTYPYLTPLAELRRGMGEMRLFDNLAVGHDGYNRCLLSPFRSTTGRNQPSNARFIFGPSAWLRNLIQPRPGQAVAYVDYSQKELGIAAALSGDGAMMLAYSSGDPYLAFAKQAGAVPTDATKKTHAGEREQFKACVLAVQYGMGEESLAIRIGQAVPYARELLRLHRVTYPAFWRWSEAAVCHAMLKGWLKTVFGWTVRVGPSANARSLANFPCQGNGAEMLRLACCLATERGVRVCCPVHDAIMVEGAADEIDSVVEQTQAAMVEASRIILDGFELRSDVKIVTHPERYSDPRGDRMWSTVMDILDGIGGDDVPF